MVSLPRWPAPLLPRRMLCCSVQSCCRVLISVISYQYVNYAAAAWVRRGGSVLVLAIVASIWLVLGPTVLIVVVWDAIVRIVVVPSAAVRVTMLGFRAVRGKKGTYRVRVFHNNVFLV